jgi:hypothetical protein
VVEKLLLFDRRRAASSRHRITKGNQPTWPPGKAWGLAPLAKPTGRQSRLKRFKEAGLAGLRHILEKPLPVGVNGGALEDGFDGLDRFVSKLNWARIQNIHHQADMASTLETHPDQIACSDGASPHIGVGKNLTFPASLQPNLEPLA